MKTSLAAIYFQSKVINPGIRSWAVVYLTQHTSHSVSGWSTLALDELLLALSEMPSVDKLSNFHHKLSDKYTDEQSMDSERLLL